MKSILLACGLFLTVLISGSSATADTIRGAVSVIRNDPGNFSPSFPIEDLFDQAHLSSSYTSGVTDFDTFDPTSVILNGGSGEWFSSNTTPGGFTDFDLGVSEFVTRLALWDHSRTGNGNATSAFEVFVSDDSAFTSATSLGSYSFLGNGDTVTGSPGQVFDIPNTKGRYVRLQHNTTQGGGGSLFGAAEFAFGTTTAVPEPSSIIIIALGVAGYSLRRRRG